MDHQPAAFWPHRLVAAEGNLLDSAGAHHGNGDAPPTYTLTDLKGGLATAIVTVTMSVGDTSPQTNRLAAFNSRGTALLLRFRGEPGQSWRIEYRANLTNGNWTPFGPQTVGPDGSLDRFGLAPPGYGSQFYRAVLQP